MEAPQLPRLKLRSDLLFTRRDYTGEIAYLIEDPVNGQYYRIGTDEYRLIRHLDGEKGLEEALELAIQEGAELSEEDLPQLAGWLSQTQLAYLQPEGRPGWHLVPPKAEKLQKNLMKLNPLFLRLDVGSPDRMVNALMPWVRWMLGPWFFVVWLLLVGSAGYQLANHWGRFYHNAEMLLSVNNAVWLLSAWVLIKTIHEFFHGFVCKKYGGYIHKAGVFFILFAPIGGYVDATSSWRFASRWQRMHVAAAGMFIEIWLAALAVWAWVLSEPGALHYLAYNTIMIAGIVTVFFNANPLMRFDGYYVFADWLDIPNLYTLGQQYTRHLNRRWIQGRRESPPNLPRPWLVKVYGIATFFWRILIMVTLLYLANVLFPGIGILLVTLGLMSWLLIPFVKFVMSLKKDPQAPAVLRYMGLLLLALLAGGGILFTQFHWSRTLSVPAILDYRDAAVVRAETPGFVRQIHVQSGQQVHQGEPLVTLENRELLAEQRNLAAQLKISQAKTQQYLTEDEPALYQAEREKLKELREKWAVMGRQVDFLEVTAPRDGTVIAEELPDRIDQYARLGEELLTIGDPGQLELILSVPQDHVDFFRAAEQHPVRVFLRARPPIDAHLDKVNPTASREILHPALTALHGGELNVRPSRQSSGGERTDSALPYEHLYPRFLAKVWLQAKHLATIPGVRPGELATVKIQTPPQSLAKWILAALERFYQRMDLRVQQQEAQQQVQ